MVMPQSSTVSPRDRLLCWLQFLLPQRLLTAVVHRLSRISTPWFKNLLIRAFIAHFEVDMSEAGEADPRRYSDFNQFFTRALRSGSRPIAEGETLLCCPVDGMVSQVGAMAGESLLQAKGQLFSLRQLLAGEEELARVFRNGQFVTLYLSPRDYHRIHMPLQGQLLEMIHVPGRLFSVSPATTRLVPELFARNERLISVFSTAAGSMALVLVGAINVACIETVWAGSITPPRGVKLRQWRYPGTGPQAVSLGKGAEMGRFNLGSTVIVLFAPGVMRWDPAIAVDAQVRMGQKLGELL
jgi:phosphatidylserine decarboxylase